MFLNFNNCKSYNKSSEIVTNVIKKVKVVIYLPKNMKLKNI